MFDFQINEVYPCFDSMMNCDSFHVLILVHSLIRINQIFISDFVTQRN